MRRRMAALAVLVGLFAACGPGIRPLDPSLGAGILTPQENDTYGLTLADAVVTAAAPATNTGSRTRAAFWQLAAAASADQQTCATWVNPSSEMQQQGAALRVRSADGRTTAITITDNIYFLARWAFNVHVMDSAAAEPFHKIGSFDLSEVFRPDGGYVAVPYPWRMCARVVGNVVSFKVWPLTHAEPAWDDPRYGGSVLLPSGWGQAGTPGWYIGHLEPDSSVGFTEMATADVVPPSETTTTTTSTTTTTLSSSSIESTLSPDSGDSITMGTAGRDVPHGRVALEATTAPRQPTWIPQAP